MFCALGPLGGCPLSRLQAPCVLSEGGTATEGLSLSEREGSSWLSPWRCPGPHPSCSSLPVRMQFHGPLPLTVSRVPCLSSCSTWGPCSPRVAARTAEARWSQLQSPEEGSPSRWVRPSEPLCCRLPSSTDLLAWSLRLPFLPCALGPSGPPEPPKPGLGQK